MQKVYSVKEVAEILGVTKTSVYHYIKRGTLESTKTASGLIRITENAINSFLAGGNTSNAQKSDNLK